MTIASKGRCPVDASTCGLYMSAQTVTAFCGMHLAQPSENQLCGFYASAPQGRVWEAVMKKVFAAGLFVLVVTTLAGTLHANPVDNIVYYTTFATINGFR